MSCVDQTAVNSPNIAAPAHKAPVAVEKLDPRPHLQDFLRTYVPANLKPAATNATAAEGENQLYGKDCPNVPAAAAGGLRSMDIFGPANISQTDINLLTPKVTAPVRVACHRGDWRNYVENTLEAIQSCIEMKADIIEVDVWRTKDGELILMHDETVDRTTNGHGKVCDLTLEEIRNLRLKDGLGNMTEFTIPTVEEVLQLCKGRIFINLDKADLYFDQVYELLLKTGTVNQVILKSTTTFEELRKKYGSIIEQVIFMPIFDVTPNTTLDDVRQCFSHHHDIYEVNFEKENKEILSLLKQLAAETGAVLWINTIWPTTCGGHSDDHALRNKENTWRYVVEEIGGGILQTDRPQLLLEYLRQIGLR